MPGRRGRRRHRRRRRAGATVVPDALERLREGVAGHEELDELVRGLADRIALDDRFASIDYDLVQAMLYLQAPYPRVKASVLKYLRCEDLTPHDRRDLGGIVPRIYASAPQWMIQRLGELMWAVERVPLVLCVDQLEDMFDLGDAPTRFRRVLATLCDITSRLPTAIVVISCLENFFDEVKRHLTQPISRRVTAGPGPVELPAACDRDQVVALIGRRLESLYRSAGVGFVPAEPTYPLPDALVRRLVGLGARDVLDEVRRYRERCIAKGKMVAYPLDDSVGAADPGGPARELDRKIVAIEQAWNEARSTTAIVVPSDESELAAILAEAIGSCTGELGGGRRALRGGPGRTVHRGRAPRRRRRGRAVPGGRVQQGPAGGRPEPADRRGRPAGRRSRAGDRALDGVPDQREVGGGAAAQQAGRRRRPARGRWRTRTGGP